MRRILLPLVLLALIGAACAGDVGSTDSGPAGSTPPTTDAPDTTSPPDDEVEPPTPASTLADLAAARMRWRDQAISDYHYEAFVGMQQPGAPEFACGRDAQLTVQVIDGSPVEARDRFSGCFVTLAAPDRVPLTVQEWFDLIEGLAREHDTLEVTFDDRGYPAEVFVEGAGLWIEWNVTEFSEGIAAPPDRDTVLAGLADARARWEAQGIGSYTMTVEVSCFCPEEYRGPFDVTVTDGVLADARFGGRPVLEAAPTEYFTIAGLFAVVEQFADSDRIDVTYDRGSGFPVLIDVDPAAEAVDEEFVIRVTDLQPPDTG